MSWNNSKNIQQTRQGRPKPLDMFSAFIASLSRKHVICAGRFLGWIAYGLDARHRRIVRRNLHFAYPQWSPERIRKLTRRVFQNPGVSFLEFCQASCFSKQDVLRNVRLKGEENLRNAMQDDNGLILISAHLGNWEMVNFFLSSYFHYPLVMVARKIQSRILHQWVYGVRSRFGNIVIDKKNAMSHMKKALRQGKMVGILIDQATSRGEGVEVDFFGRTVTATPAVSLLARRYDCPVLPVFCVRDTDAELTLIIEPPLALKRTKNLRSDLQENTQRMTHVVEKAVRAYPEQWFWFHKRWKQNYPFLYPEDLARRKRRRAKREAKLKIIP